MDEALALSLGEMFRSAGVHDKTTAASIIEPECRRALGRVDAAAAKADSALAAAGLVHNELDQARGLPEAPGGGVA